MLVAGGDAADADDAAVEDDQKQDDSDVDGERAADDVVSVIIDEVVQRSRRVRKPAVKWQGVD